jgi:outer membrane murein-binding lipoprotein Lpp
VPNAITELCSELEKTINQNVQRALTTLEQDCTTLTASVAQLSIGHRALREEEQKKRNNATRRNRAVCCAVLGFVCWPIIAVLALLHALVNRALVDDPLHLSAFIDQLGTSDSFQ